MPGALLLIAALAQVSPEAGPTPLGLWINPARSVAVEIRPCGPDESGLCGYVRWASDEAKADARSGGTAELIGVELMRGFEPVSGTRWRGRLFVPDLRKRSKAELRLLETGGLKVTGCAAAKLVCRSQVWTRITPEQLLEQTSPAAR